MPGKAAKVTITERQMEILESLTNSPTTSVCIAQRANIILLAFQKKLNIEISEIVQLNPQQVGYWRKRWKAAWENLIDIECSQTITKLRRAIETLLSDKHRSGRKSRFTTEQQASIIAIACEDPQESERPISTWTQREIADEAIKRKIVDTISPNRVRDFLKDSRLETASQ